MCSHYIKLLQWLGLVFISYKNNRGTYRYSRCGRPENASSLIVVRELEFKSLWWIIQYTLTDAGSQHCAWFCASVSRRQVSGCELACSTAIQQSQWTDESRLRMPSAKLRRWTREIKSGNLVTAPHANVSTCVAVSAHHYPRVSGEHCSSTHWVNCLTNANALNTTRCQIASVVISLVECSVSKPLFMLTTSQPSLVE